MKIRGTVGTARIASYTSPVTARRLLALAVLLVPGAALAAPPPNTGDTARGAAQTARAAADAADQVADGSLAGITDKEDSPETTMDRARRGVVTLERRGKVLGVGTVLSGDGRILTALSPLGHGNNLDARFADGSVTRVKVGHTDRAWDLALLVPQNGRWKKGLRAARESATQAGSNLRVFSLVGQKELAPARTIVKGQRTLMGADNELLHDAIELASRLKSTDVGSPVIDDKGDVVAIIARACAPVPNAPCTRVPFGVPTPAIKAFLRTVPANAVPPAPWLGIQGVADDAGAARGVRVISVHPRSPAAAAGLKGSRDRNTADTVVAVNGAPVSTPEALAETINQRAVGDSVELLLFGGGKFRQVTLTLRAAPDQNRKKAPAVKRRSRP